MSNQSSATRARNFEVAELQSYIVTKTRQIATCIVCDFDRVTDGETRIEFAARLHREGWRFENGYGDHKPGPVCHNCIKERSKGHESQGT